MAAKEQQLFGYSKETVDQLNNYFLEKPAKEAIPFLKLLGAGIGFTVTVEDKVADPEIIKEEGFDSPVFEADGGEKN